MLVVACVVIYVLFDVFFENLSYSWIVLLIALLTLARIVVFLVKKAKGFFAAKEEMHPEREVITGLSEKGVSNLVYIGAAAVVLVSILFFYLLNSSTCTGYLSYLCEFTDYILMIEVAIVLWVVSILRRKKKEMKKEGIIQGL
ncbi:MAG: hypothetical protein HXS48_15980 [Theionarchaea archaeon]|nr:hypothetical protein [Theionarchaea archaeon]